MQRSITASSELQCASALLVSRCIYFAHTAGDKRVKTDFMGEGHIFAGCVRYIQQAALLLSLIHI